jgi:uncharacterized protein YqcC (DUF446 family)
MPDHHVVEIALNTVEAEMKRIGMWQSKPLTPEQMNFSQAFAGDTMAFEQWLQFIFVPRVRSIIASKGKFPAHSQVSDQAFREWMMYDQRPEVEPLIALLRQFDALFN